MSVKNVTEKECEKMKKCWVCRRTEKDLRNEFAEDYKSLSNWVDHVAWSDVSLCPVCADLFNLSWEVEAFEQDILDILRRAKLVLTLK